MSPTSESEAERTRVGNWGLFTVLAAGGWIAAGAAEWLFWAVLTPARGDSFDAGEATRAVFAYWGVSALLTPPLIWAIQRAPFERGRIRRAIVVHLIVLAGLIVAHSLLRQIWINAMVTHELYPFASFVGDIPTILSRRMGGALLVFLVNVGAVNVRDYYQRYRERARAAAALALEQARLRASLSEARLEALQMRLQPHFLFNVLHAISTLVLKGDTRAADRMISHLSDFLRMTLDRADETTVPLAVELESLEAYLRIQKERFQDRLRVTIQIADEALPAAVPNLVFQPLVENSIKHGTASETGSGAISVRATVADGRLTLEVEDDGHGHDGTADEGIGLGNIRERLEQLYPGAHQCVLEDAPTGGTRARIVIPFRPVERDSTRHAG